MRKIRLLTAIAALALLAGAAAAPAAKDGVRKVRDARADTKRLKRKRNLDIRRVIAANESGNRLKYKIKMQGKLKPKKKFSRPFILINTRGGKKSDFEYLLLGPRVFKKRADDRYVKVGANKFKTRRKSWIYRFKPSRIGLEPGDRYGFAALTAKGRTVDLAPDRRYRNHRVTRVPVDTAGG